MRILIDISHVAHLNFFKQFVKKISGIDNEIIVTVLDRGSLWRIANQELHSIRLVKSGRHRGGVLSIIFQANILKFCRLYKIVNSFKPEIGFSCGGFILGAAMKLHNKPNIQFDDDPERKISVFLERITSTKLYFPPIIKPDSKIKIFNSLKEWSYLSPKYFTPDEKSIGKYHLKRKDYIFLRIVDNNTLNYFSQDKVTLTKVIIDSLKDHNVLLSIENKDDIKNFPIEWVKVKEPEKEIHSLMYFSKLIVSTGDSMAREGAMLGVPSIYCGGREMKANDFISQFGLFLKVSPQELFRKIEYGVSLNVEQVGYRNNFLNSWTDLNTLILSEIVNI